MWIATSVRIATAFLRRRRELSVDRRESGVHWVEARRTRSGIRPLAWGCCEVPEDDPKTDVLARFAQMPLARGRRLGAALRSQQLRHQRIDLPPATSRRGARLVAERRLRSLLGERGEDAVGAFHLAVQRSGGRAWLATAPRDRCEELTAAFLDHDLALETISSRHFALGSLARLLPPAEDGALTALFDVERDIGTCVVVDDEGWLFSREVKHKFMGDRMVQPVETARSFAVEAAEPNALSFEPEVGEALDATDVELDPFEMQALEIERLATEIQRTIRYVETELALGKIRRTVLCGEVDGLIGSLPALSERLEHPVRDLRGLLRECRGIDVSNESAVALGALLVPDSGTQLLPEPSASVVRGRTGRRKLLRVAAALLVVLTCAFGVRAIQERDLRAEIARRETMWTESAPARRSVEEGLAMRARGELLEAGLDRLRGEAPPWIALLHTVAALLPERTEVRRLEIFGWEDGWRANLALRSEAESVSDAAGQVSAFTERLGAAPFVAVEDVRQEESGSSRTGQLRSAHFSVKLRLAPVAGGGRG
jgi:hypothetical protein